MRALSQTENAQARSAPHAQQDHYTRPALSTQTKIVLQKNIRTKYYTREVCRARYAVCLFEVRWC